MIDSLHAVTRTEPAPLRCLGGRVPAELQRIVDKCLRKDPARRCQHADDLVVDLRALAADVDSGAAFAVPIGADLDTAAPAATPGTPPWVLASGAALMLVMGTAIGWMASRPEARPPAGVVHFTIELPPGETDFSHESQQILAISPDGSQVVFGADGKLWLRLLGELESVRIPDTAGAGTPVFSPDSRHLAFFDSGSLMRIALDGNSAVEVGDIGDLAPQGLSWAHDGFIYAGVVRENAGAVVRFPETGGQAEVVVEPGEPGGRIYGPQLLPGGGWLLFTLTTSSHGWDSAQVMVQSLSTNERRVLVEGGHDARVTASGHLIYAVGGTLLAQSFDANGVAVRPGVLPVLEHVRTSFANWTGAAFYGFSENGTLVSVSGENESDVLSTFNWIDREGKSLPLPIEAKVFHDEFALSPDGRFVAASHLEDGARRIWIYPVDRPGGQRLTAGPSWDPVWSEDGDWIYYSMGDFDGQDIGRRRSDLSGPEEEVLVAPGLQFPEAVSPGGEWLYFVDIDAAQNLSISRMSLRDGSEPQLLVGGGGQYYKTSLSPNGRYMAMQSDPNATDEDEIVVVDLETRRRWRVSGAGWGRSPMWSARGDEIVYNSEEGVMAAAVTTEPEFSVGVPRMLFPHRDHLRSAVRSGLNVSKLAVPPRYDGARTSTTCNRTSPLTCKTTSLNTCNYTSPNTCNYPGWLSFNGNSRGETGAVARKARGAAALGAASVSVS